MPTTSRTVRRTRRPVAACLGTIAAVVLLTSCRHWADGGAIQGIGPTDRTSAVGVYSAAVVVDGSGAGTLVAGLLNRGDDPDRLTGLSVSNASGEVPVRLAHPVPLPRLELVKLARTGAVSVRADRLQPGRLSTVTFRFAHAAPTTFKVTVEPRSGPYSEVPMPAA